MLSEVFGCKEFTLFQKVGHIRAFLVGVAETGRYHDSIDIDFSLSCLVVKVIVDHASSDLGVAVIDCNDLSFLICLLVNTF